MEKKHEEFNKQYNALLDNVKDAICERMKKLVHIEFNTLRDFPFMNQEGEFKSVEVLELEYTEEGDVDAIPLGDPEDRWSIQLEGTVDGCIELLYYLEEEAYEVIE